MYVYTRGIKVDTFWLELAQKHFLRETVFEITELCFKLLDCVLFSLTPYTRVVLVRNEDKNRMDMNPPYDGPGQEDFVAFSLL